MGSYLRLFAIALGLVIAIGLSAVAFGDGGLRYQLVEIRGKVFSLEIANSPEARMRGLRGRASLDPEEGMLVRLEKPERLSYSTRYTSFPIDVLYIDEEFRVVQVDQLKANDSRLTASSSEDPVWGAILLHGGSASLLRVERGYQFKLQQATQQQRHFGDG